MRDFSGALKPSHHSLLAIFSLFPIIFCVGAAACLQLYRQRQAGDKRKSLQAGMGAHLAKPVDIESLRRVL